jgi:hypothetical protein
MQGGTLAGAYFIRIKFSLDNAVFLRSCTNAGQIKIEKPKTSTTNSGSILTCTIENSNTITGTYPQIKALVLML